MSQPPNKYQSSQKRTQSLRPAPRPRQWPGRLLLVVILALMSLVLWQRQAISDWIQLYGYEPPAEVTQLARQTHMTSDAQHLFYLNKPQITGKTAFSNYCTNYEQTIVLGCYHGGQDGIYILYVVNTPELSGVMQVTAAHEMLHAAYERLSDSEKTRIDTELTNFYNTKLKDVAIKDEVEAYRKTEPNALVNEMHSIFGTEVSNLPPSLESYYKRYFSNRQAVVKQAAMYANAFRSREAAVKRYDAQLQKLAGQVTSEEAALTEKGKALQQERARLEAYKNSGNVNSYNAAVPAYNQLVRSYNALLNKIKAEIAQYNKIVERRNALIVEEQRLAKQLSGDNLPSLQ